MCLLAHDMSIHKEGKRNSDMRQNMDKCFSLVFESIDVFFYLTV
jgi:hypothetical protein